MISNLSSNESGCGCGGGGTASAAPCSCGGAGCGSCIAQGIVRPRFFAGQLLTEDDLQLLSDYVGQKNRLHNRHLFGAGVVCGLEVSCDPCGDGRVIVHPGYAIDCCGNDLTLSCPQVVDLNALVRKLRKNDCVEPCPEPRKPKGKTEEKEDPDDPDKKKPNFRYCLYIRYCEQPSDPVTPYSTGEECVQVGCEPTRIREGVSFELRCVDPHIARNPLLERLCLSLGDLDKLRKVFAAFDTLSENLKNLEKAAATVRRSRFLRAEDLNERIPRPDEFRPTDKAHLKPSPAFLLRNKSAFNMVRDWLIERLSKSSFITDCTLKARVYDLTVPGNDDSTEMEIIALVENDKALAGMFIDYLRSSICRVLNPACLPCEDSAVLLACLDWEECEVKRICNMERTFVLSPAAVRYWLPPLQLAGNVLEQLCCAPLDDFPRQQTSEDQTLMDILKEQIKRIGKEEIDRILKDSNCVSDNNLTGALDGLDRMFRKVSDGQAKDLGTPVDRRSTQRETEQGTTSEDVSTASGAAEVESTSARATKKASTKKTAMKAAIKGATKTASKASEAAPDTSKPAETAKAAEPEKAATPGATGTPAAEPTTTTPKGDEK